MNTRTDIQQEIEDEDIHHIAQEGTRVPPLRIQILEEAQRLTSADRNKAYGDPYENHSQIARIFNAITGRDLDAREIALVHVATKLARLSKNHGHDDSHVDAAAYIGIVRECANKDTPCD
jgi:hypothetical protein